jgi:hypothetical protein
LSWKVVLGGTLLYLDLVKLNLLFLHFNNYNMDFIRNEVDSILDEALYAKGDDYDVLLENLERKSKIN